MNDHDEERVEFYLNDQRVITGGLDDPVTSRDTEIERIAAALDTVPVGDYPWHHDAPHHPEYAAALYDAGLRSQSASEPSLNVAVLERAISNVAVDVGRLVVADDAANIAAE